MRFPATAPESYASLREAVDDLERLEFIAEAALENAIELYAPSAQVAYLGKPARAHPALSWMISLARWIGNVDGMGRTAVRGPENGYWQSVPNSR